MLCDFVYITGRRGRNIDIGRESQSIRGLTRLMQTSSKDSIQAMGIAPNIGLFAPDCRALRRTRKGRVSSTAAAAARTKKENAVASRYLGGKSGPMPSLPLLPMWAAPSRSK